MDPELVAPMEDGLRMDAVAFKRVEAVRTEMWRPLAEIFARCDALPTPTNAIPAPGAEGSDGDWLARKGAGRLIGFDMTSPINKLSPCPALSVPSGLARDGLPTGAQIVARPFDDPTALRIGAAVEAARPFARWRDLPRQ